MKKYLELSVIIPCYNVEDYIEDCLDSIVNQKILPREIILIDDGSTDNTAEKIKNYIRNYPFISYYYQLNSGVGEARNKGIKEAKYTYIQFIDPDDLIKPRSFELFSNIIESNKSIDLLYFNFSSFKEKKASSMSPEYISISPKHTGNGDKLIEYLLEENKYSGACWRYIFRKELITHGFEGRVHEDHLFSLQLILAAQHTYYLPNNIYYYRVRNDSLSHSQKNISYANSFYNVLKKCLILINNSSISEKSKQKYRISMVTLYLSAMFSCGVNKNDDLKLIYGYYELLYRINILNKTSYIGNLCFINRLSKKVKYSYLDKLKLIKSLSTGRYPQDIYHFDSNLILY